MMPPEPMTANKLERWAKDSQKLMQQAESAFNGPEMAAAVLQMRRATAIAVNCTKGVVDAAGRQAGKPKPSRRSTKTVGRVSAPPLLPPARARCTRLRCAGRLAGSGGVAR